MREAPWFHNTSQKKAYGQRANQTRMVKAKEAP